jgi:hypothetical protein
MDLSTTQIASSIRECDRIVILIQKPDYHESLTLDTVLAIKEMLLKIEEEISKCGESAAKKKQNVDELEGMLILS